MRFIFDSIVRASQWVDVGRPDSEEDLERDLATLARVYRASDFEALLTLAFDDPSANVTGYYADVPDYYAGTAAQLTGVHNAEGAIHFGLDWDGNYSREGFYAQARIVEQIAKDTRARSVLEVGPGKGFNSVHLAERNPDLAFTGIDLTPLHVELASGKGGHLSNLRFVQGNFHDMKEIESDAFDIAFDVEAICYSDTPDKLAALFAELHRVLRPGGLFVSFNYVLSDGAESASRNARLAAKLVERAWVIDHFHREGDWNAQAAQAGFQVMERRDLREAALPSITRLYRQARMFYLSMATPLRPVLSKLVRRSTHNAISALMLPYTFGLGSVEYRQVVLRKAVDDGDRGAATHMLRPDTTAREGSN